MSKNNEAEFENTVVSWLDDSGWNCYSGSEYTNRYNHSSKIPIFTEILSQKVSDINPTLTDEDIKSVVREFTKQFVSDDTLVSVNKDIYEILYRGINVYLPSVDKRRIVRLIDLDSWGGNQFDAVQQFRIDQNSNKIRPDIVLFVNGIPLFIGELKSTSRMKTVNDAISDIHEYEKAVPRLFYSVLGSFGATKMTLKYGAVGSSELQYKQWRPEERDNGELPGKKGYDVERSVRSLFAPKRVIDFIRDYVFFLDTVPTVSKIIPRHQQYFALTRIQERIIQAREQEESASGLVWHTQGSGKSITSELGARWVTRELNTMAVIIVDTLNLKEQFGSELKHLSPGVNIEIPESKKELRQLLEKAPSKIVLTNIQLFDDIGSKCTDEDIVLFSDEAHRYMEGDFGSHIECAVPKAHHFGFTGTPIQNGDYRDTFSNFAMTGITDVDTPFLHRYSMRRAVEEGVILRVSVVDRCKSITWEIDDEKMDSALLSRYDSSHKNDVRSLIASELDITELSETDSFVSSLAKDVAEYFTTHVSQKHADANNGMVVMGSRLAAAKMGSKLQSLLGKDNVDVLYSSNQTDSEELSQYHTTVENREEIKREFKRSNDPRILVVCNMLLTGFNAPTLRTIFLVRNMKDHVFMQAIARANRPCDGKPFGEIVDYRSMHNRDKSMYNELSSEIDVYLTEDKDLFIEQFTTTLATLQSMCVSDPGSIGDSIRDVDSIVNNRNVERFQDQFSRLRKIRQALQPDARILSYDAHFKEIQAVSQSIRALESTENPIDKDEFINNAKDAIESGSMLKHTPEEVHTKDPFTIEEWLPENVKALRMVHTVRDVLSSRQRVSPVYDDLSSRVERIIREWESEAISSKEAITEFTSVEQEFLTIPEPHEMTAEEWVTQVVSDVIIDETSIEAQNIPPDLVDIILGTISANWELTSKMNKENRVNKLKKEIEKSLIEYGTEHSAMILTSQCTQAVPKYLLENMDRVEEYIQHK